MKSSLVKINKFIPLLTDTLPYEIPVLFSNRGFYATIKKSYDTYYNKTISKKASGNEIEIELKIEDFFKTEFINDHKIVSLKELLCQTFKNDTIPYDYWITQSNEKRRKISLIHPFAQLKICDFYSKYENQIIYNTTISDVSLRHPFKVTSKTFRKHTTLLNKLTKEAFQANCEDISETLEDKKKLELENIPNSYFVYKRHPFLYKFYDSKSFLHLEKKYQYCFKFDLKRCFDSIYTHSISWAVKNKNFAKKYKSNENNSFEKDIDKIMQYSNWGETHGIPIGSEFSRIFAEIILQRVDQNVENEIESKDFLVSGKSIKSGRDFIIKRYVDDYFVFVNNKNIANSIIEIYEKKLIEYKLFINHDKNIEMSRPFITKITSAKQKIMPELRKYLHNFHGLKNSDKGLHADNLFSNVYNCTNSTKYMIEKIRVDIYDNGIEMIDISNLLFSKIKKELIKVLDILMSIDNLHEDNIRKSKKYLEEVLDLSFYIFHLSNKANTTYGICKICFIVQDILKKINNKKNINEINQKIYSQFLLFFENREKLQNSPIESLDIIWILDKLGDNYTIPQERLENLLQATPSYFEIVVVLSYIKNKNEYKGLKEKILEKIEQKIKSTDNIFTHTETFIMFFDIMKCPYIEDSYKRKILDIIGITENKKDIINFITSNNWFFGWNEEINLKNLFEIKELQNVY